MPTTTEDNHDIVEDAIYQIHTSNGPIRRYVRAIKVYGDKGLVDCEIVKSRERNVIGKKIQCAIEILKTPDQYPRFQFNPDAWTQKVAQSASAKKQEIANFIDNHVQAMFVTAADMQGDNALRTVEAIKALLMPFFGGFTLALFINFIKGRIDKALVNHTAKPQPKSFQSKISEMNRIWSKKSANDNMRFANNLMHKKAEETPESKKQGA